MRTKGIGLGVLSTVIGITVLLLTQGSGEIQAPPQPVLPPNSSESTKAPVAQEAPLVLASTEASSITNTSVAQEPHTTDAYNRTNPQQAVSEYDIIVGDQRYPNLPYKMTASTNDPYVDQPWEQQIYLPQARAIGAGGYAPKVAIIDSGIALQHEDLRDSSWLTNAGESGSTANEAPSRLNCSDRQLALNRSCNNIDDNFDGIVDNETGATTVENMSQRNCTDLGLPLTKSCNNIDDDGNGLIDDYQGFDFTSFDRSVEPGQTDAYGDGVTHGTLIAGVLAARNNNAVGLAGVSSNARILPLQALDDSGSGYTSTVSEAIYYAIERDVDVISMSLGGETLDLYLQQAVQAANRAGIVVVAAAGNDSCECAQYPAAYESVISVGATDANKQRASFSNWGQTVDVVAPGVNLYTTSWSVSNQTARYGYASGTSLSTPVISGMVALLLSHSPTAAPLQIKALMYEKAQRLDMAPGQYRSSSFGHGLLNAQSSLGRVVTSLTAEQVYSYAQIRGGSRAYGDQWGRSEVAKNIIFYSCESGSSPSVAVTKLTKGDLMVYSASEAEVSEAIANGFTASAEFYWCTLFDHDTVAMIRSMNLYAELYNTYRKDE